ncbi:hypothetical protein KQI58_03325 [Enterococcus raffinosus]|uniref:hypothetical protein n=1 Tax=Enterococcus raffinosus TaxID=71452 RepID=UPI001C127EA6|nr:hypothetical protein [Enterococcus raffinosus]MBU5360109.1 hypothetical protein [Enterococcus raffinosus]
MEKEKKIIPVDFLWLALYAFAGFSLELLLGLVSSGLSLAVNAGLTAILWSAVALFLIHYAKSRFNFDVFSISRSLENKKLILIICLVFSVIVVSTIGFGGFKPVVEFNGELEKSIIAFIFRLFYYFAECSLIVLVIAFGQKFFESQFGLSERFPSGGLLLAITWGLIHFLLQGFSGGLYTIFFSVVAGCIYLLCQKDIRWTYLFVAIAFIL